MGRPNLNQIVTESVFRPLKKPIWYTVHALTGIRMQMPAYYIDGSMFSASFQAPVDKVQLLLPSSKLSPVECSIGKGEILILTNEFRHIDILYPYNEVAITIPVSYQPGEGIPSLLGMWYLHMPVTTEDARWPGVENLGVSQICCENTI